MRTIEEFEVTRQLLGNLAIEGDFYDTLGEALWAYDRECAALEGSGRVEVCLLRCESDFDDGGECFEVRHVETIARRVV